jgi:hypothetical protein
MNPYRTFASLAAVTLLCSATIALAGDKSAWIERNYSEQITLGNDPDSGVAIYPHRSVQIEYAVDCASGKIRMVAWTMYSKPNAMGDLVWANRLRGADATERFTPGSQEEREVVSNSCHTSAASR